MEQVPSMSIMSVDEEVKDVLAQGTEPTKRGVCTKFTTVQKAEIGKRAAECGMAATIQYAIGVVNGHSYLQKFFPQHFVRTRFGRNLHLENLALDCTFNFPILV